MALKPSSALFIALGLCIDTSQLWATEPTAETATTTVEEVLTSTELVVPAGGASTILMPLSARRQLIDIQFYSDARDALIKAIQE